MPCPHCGEYVLTSAEFCPHCGSDRETGWANEEEIAYQSLDLPEEPDEDSVEAARRTRDRKRRLKRGAVLALISMSVLSGLAAFLFAALARGC